MDILNAIDRLAGWWFDWRTDQHVRQLPDEYRNLHLHKAEFGRDGWNIVAYSPAVVAMADQAADMLTREKAENYVEFVMQPRIDRGKPPIRVTVQWANKLSPAQKASRLELERDDWKARCSELQAKLDKKSRRKSGAA